MQAQNLDNFKNQIKSMGFKEPSNKDCEAYLKNSKGNLERAIQEFLESGKAEASVQQKQTPQQKEILLKLFAQYKSPCEFDSNLKAICGDGLIKFAKDLGLSPDSIDFYYLFCKFSPKILSIITEQEFIDGMTALRCTNIQDLAKSIPIFKQEIKQIPNYEKMYNQYYDMIKRIGKKERLDVDDVSIFHGLLLQNPANPVKTKLIDDYITFLESLQSGKQQGNTTGFSGDEIYITKDTWDMTWQFFKRVYEKNSDLSWYSETSHYPTLIDEFMEWKEKNK